MRSTRSLVAVACAGLLALACGEDRGQVGGDEDEPGSLPATGEPASNDEDVMNPFAHDTSGEIVEVDDVEVGLELFDRGDGRLRIHTISLTSTGDRDLRVREPRGADPTIEDEVSDGTWTWTWLRAPVPAPDEDPAAMGGEWDVPNIRAAALLAGESLELRPTRSYAIDAGPQRLRVCVEVEDTEVRGARMLEGEETGDRERMREWRDGQDILVACSAPVDVDLAELPEYG